MTDQTNNTEEIIKVGQTFTSWNFVEEAIKKYVDATGYPFIRNNTKTVEAANRRLSGATTRFPVGENFKYEFCRFTCKHFGKRESTSTGVRPNQKTQRTGCEAQIYIYLDRKRRLYVVRTVEKDHNHGINPLKSEAILKKEAEAVAHKKKEAEKIKQEQNIPTEHFVDDDWMANSMRDIYSMFMQDELCDCIIAFTKSGSGLMAHKLVLGAHSEILKASLLASTTALMPHIDNLGIKLPIWRHILSYMYTGRISCLKKEVSEIEEASHTLQMDSLRELLENKEEQTGSHGSQIKTEIEESDDEFDEGAPIPLSDDDFEPQAAVDSFTHDHDYRSQQPDEDLVAPSVLPVVAPRNVVNKPLQNPDKKRKDILDEGNENNSEYVQIKRAKIDPIPPVPIDEEKIEMAKQMIDQINTEQTMKQETASRTYQCKMCAYACTHRTRMVSHMMRKHNVSESGLAEVMDQTFKEPTIRQVREDDIIMGTTEPAETETNANIANELDMVIGNLEQAEEIPHENIAGILAGSNTSADPVNKATTGTVKLCDVQYKCSDCDKWFPKWMSRTHHLRRMHNVIEKYENGTSFPDFAKPSCSICGKVFATEMKRKYHEAKHNSLMCDICAAPFPRISDLKEHVEAKHGEGAKGLYKCHLCPSARTYRRGLIKHLAEKHGIKAKFEPTKYKAEKIERVPCKECGETFASRATRTKHYYEVHLNQENPNRKSFQCSICNKILKNGTKSSIKAHLQLHVTAVEEGRIYECSGCKSKFKFKRELYNHTRICETYHSAFKEARVKKVTNVKVVGVEDINEKGVKFKATRAEVVVKQENLSEINSAEIAANTEISELQDFETPSK